MEIKGVCHVHSNYSHDGEISLAELKDYFKNKGFQFLILTEHLHDVSTEKIRQIIDDCRALSESGFKIIPGLELDDNKKHYLIIGIDGSQYSAEDLIKKSSSNKIIVWAHPFFIASPSAAPDHSIDGMEIWNSVYDGKKFPRWGALKLLKKIREKKNIYGFCGLDFHRFSHAGGPYLIMDIENLSSEEILKNLKIGKFSIQRGNIMVEPDGRLSNGRITEVKLYSPLICWFLSFVRLAGRILYALRLKPSKKVKELIRSKI
jgi:hypothetical protein